MPRGNPKIDEETFIRLFQEKGAAGTAKAIGVAIRSVYARRSEIERRRGTSIVSPTPAFANVRVSADHPHRQGHEIDNGVVLVGSDSHYWPSIPPTTAHRAFVKLCKDLKPKGVVKNGDELDFPGISKHAAIGWETRPAVVDEIDEAKARLEEIESASPGAWHDWPLGNHDGRFESRLAMVAPEYAKVHGVHLKDHFPRWSPCWSVWVNDDVVIKHRFKAGIHATHNNTVWAGKTMVTGHLHSLRVTPFTDYNGHRWGVDCGTIANPDGPQFTDYTEDNPKNWRSGFIVLTFHKGKLLWPEVVHVVDEDHVSFRGQLIRV